MTSMDFSSDSGLDPILFSHTNPMLSSIMGNNNININTLSSNASSSHAHQAGTSESHLTNGSSPLKALRSVNRNNVSGGCSSDDSASDLFAHETLDRDSPDLWPETIPGVTEFVARSQSPMLSTISSSAGASSLSQSKLLSSVSHSNQLSHQNHPMKSEWLGDPDLKDAEDINMIQGFGSLTSSALLDKVRELQDLAYQLGLEEEQEMIRGRFLNVLSTSSSNTSRFKRKSSPSSTSRLIKIEKSDDSHSSSNQQQKTSNSDGSIKQNGNSSKTSPDLNPVETFRIG